MVVHWYGVGYLFVVVVDPKHEVVLVQVELVHLAVVGGGGSFDRPGNI